jgi:hypothetical protein
LYSTEYLLSKKYALLTRTVNNQFFLETTQPFLGAIFFSESAKSGSGHRSSHKVIENGSNTDLDPASNWTCKDFYIVLKSKLKAIILNSHIQKLYEC